ncbi:TonB-dependent receptor plug domain-containing protein [Niabella aquatica]
MRFYYTLSLILVAAILCPFFVKGQTVTGTDTIFQLLKIIDKNDIAKTNFVNLSELLQYELNMDIERYPADGGARLRMLDLSSRYYKILINGIPVGGSDMFGGNVDISGIALNNVDSIVLSNTPQGVIYGSGTLAGVVNIITAKAPENGNTSLHAFVQETSAGKEYSLRGGDAAKGLHIQSLSFSHRLSPKFTVGLSGMRNAFEGCRGSFNGTEPVSTYSYGRGFKWSPYTAYNGDGYLAYKTKKLSAFYTGSYYHADLTYYNPLVKEWDGAGAAFYAIDFRYVNTRARHHGNLQYRFWKNAEFTADLSWQQAVTKRRIAPVNTQNNELIENVPLQTLYQTKTGYGRATLVKPFSHRLQWGAGMEADRTAGFIAAADGTYQTTDLDKAVFSIAGFSWLQWRVNNKWAFQPGIRMAGNGLSKARPSFSLATNYRPNDRNDLKLVLEQVQRFPSHRELFTYLENEFNMLRGNEKLKPETGTAVLLYWQNDLLQIPDARLQLTLQTAYRELKDRIVIAADKIVGIQELYRYANVNKYASWQNTAGLHWHEEKLNVQAAFSVTGLKGTDNVDAGQYDQFLFHTEANAVADYNFCAGIWLRANYHYVGSRPIYTLERPTVSSELVRVHNRAPAFHLLNLNAGRSFFKNRLELSIGGQNLLNVKEINFSATDGQEHYTGDLRTLNIGYGRGWVLRLGYQM